ncbi:RRXRR domain-containing protein, partial [Coleofasciculus sp. G2-EDA-02]|uniref:RRXRR domain-containing protein n=1 Tax=Coleofasciculus sp. G2-EDA-02 TaxID=3069529 RepID=UPI0032F80FBD
MLPFSTVRLVFVVGASETSAYLFLHWCLQPGDVILIQQRMEVWVESSRYPFTIIMKQEVKNPVVKEHRLKIDPGSQVTGLAILEGNRVVFAAELTHRGLAIKATLESRRAIRRGRRNRHTRYRKPRFNRFRSTGWLAPSLQHRVDTTLTWVNRLRKLAPISFIS